MMKLIYRMKPKWTWFATKYRSI